jgi:glycosyltransferase involved in cell wall biosynthesis
MSQLLVNLAFLPTKPTGHAIYARNLLPALQALKPLLLTPQPIAGFDCAAIPADLNPDFGTKGHGKRLLWGQFCLPKLYRQRRASLLFSPIPEAPLWAGCRSVVTLHDLIPIRFPRRSPLTTYFRYYIPQVLKQAQHVLCDSQATADDAMQYYQIPARQLSVVPLGYDVAHFWDLHLPSDGMTPTKISNDRSAPLLSCLRTMSFGLRGQPTIAIRHCCIGRWRNWVWAIG